jgi:hypothetical protein
MSQHGMPHAQRLMHLSTEQQCSSGWHGHWLQHLTGTERQPRSETMSPPLIRSDSSSGSETARLKRLNPYFGVWVAIYGVQYTSATIFWVEYSAVCTIRSMIPVYIYQ